MFKIISGEPAMVQDELNRWFASNVVRLREGDRLSTSQSTLLNPDGRIVLTVVVFYREKDQSFGGLGDE